MGEAARRPTLSFGLGASGTGVPFHQHGPVFAEVVHGKKRWFLYPPEEKPDFDPQASSLQWLTSEYPKLVAQNKTLPMDCVALPGELLYTPDGWYHATLNL